MKKYLNNFVYSDMQSRAVCRCRRFGGFSLLELIVVMAIVSLMLGIMTPALQKGRRNAWAVRCMNGQRQIVTGVSCFAADNDGRFPPSVATIGTLDTNWNWQEPTMLTSRRKLSPKLHRSVGEYLRGYFGDAEMMFCPNAPRKYRYLQQAWEAGDQWDNPETPESQDPVIGTYCFYWNYTGFLEWTKDVFKGPQGMAVGGPSGLLVSDYLGYGHWRNNLTYRNCEVYTSSEKFDGSAITPGTCVSSDFWSLRPDAKNIRLEALQIELHAGYTDGHVERYSASEVVPMKVSMSSDGTVPYPDDLGPGLFYLPKNYD